MKAFQFSIKNHIAHIRLNQPGIGNPINAAFCKEFNELSIECGENNKVKAVFIDAAGDYFSVGGDLKEFMKHEHALPAVVKSMTANLHMAVARFARNDAPIVLAANNLVVGGAVALVAASDFVYATPKTQFYAAFTSAALCGDTGISYYLPRRVGSRKATEFLLLNEMWSAEQAKACGLINDIVEPDQLEQHCLGIAAKLAKAPTEVLGRMRRLLLSSYNQPIEAQLEDEARAMVECAKSKDVMKAMHKLVNKK